MEWIIKKWRYIQNFKRHCADQKQSYQADEIGNIWKECNFVSIGSYEVKIVVNESWEGGVARNEEFAGTKLIPKKLLATHCLCIN